MAGENGKSEEKVLNVVIVGSGPAAHTAAIYTARAELQPLLFEGFLAGGVAAGGQLTTTTDVENFPGFPDGIQGLEITDRFRQQSINMGAKILTETVSGIDLKTFPYTVTSEMGTVVKAKAVILATGATARRLDITGSQEYWQRGVSACAVCDGAAPFFRDVPLAVVGGGDTAMEEASFLTKYGSHVYIIHRRDELRASKTMQRRVRSNPKIEFLLSHVVTEVIGDGKKVTELRLLDTKTEEERRLECNGLFFAIGHIPNTTMVAGEVDQDEAGYILTKADSTETNVPGLFAAGDCQDKKYRQAVTAAGSGCMAALDVEHYLGGLAHEGAEV